MIAGIRLRAGKAGSGRGAASMITEAIGAARQAGATGQLLVRGDSAYGNSKVIAACRRADARFSVVLTRTRHVDKAIAAIDDQAWTPVRYPGSVIDPDTGALISDAQVAETPFTAFGSTAHPVTARLIVRRVRDQAKPDGLFPVYRYHPFLTDNDEPVTDADLTHRAHAIIETVHSDLIDGPLAGMPSGRFPANNAWAICAALTHNLLRAAGTIAAAGHAVARGATLRRHIITVPGPAGPTTTTSRAPPTRPLALGRSMDPPAPRRLRRRHRPTRRSLTSPVAQRPDQGNPGKLARPADTNCPRPGPATRKINYPDQDQQRGESTDRG